MRHLTLISILYASLTSWGQDREKLLSKTQLDSVNNGQTVYYKVDGVHCKYFENFQGTTKVKKIKGKIYFDFINESSRFDKDGRLSDKFTYDKLGLAQTYQAFNTKGEVISDCSYETKVIKGDNYRLEYCKHYYFHYSPTVLMEESHRYLKLTDIGGHFLYSRNKNYGIWNYYGTNGQLQKTKDFGDIE